MNGTTMKTEAMLERNRFLRNCVPGERVRLGCSDNSTRTVEITHRLELDNETAVLKAKGHGTRYQINAPGPDKSASPAQVRSSSVFAFVTDVELVEESDQLWSDTTAEDLGVEKL